jgi:large subunit ribosomal protein L3
MPLGLLGKKLGHTRVYDANGTLVPVTAVLCGPNRVLQIRTVEKDGYSAVQLGFGDQKPQRIAKPVLGHLAKFGALSPDDAKTARKKGDKRALTAVAKIKEFRNFPTHVPAPPPKQNGAEKKEGEEKKEAQKPEMKEVRTGDLLGPTLFNVGEFVDAIGITKGRGFEGVVGRWAFRGGDSTHGAKGWHRRSGAIGCRLFPGHVNKGMKMPGHMGQVRRTAQNLEIIQVREADNLLLIKGSFPGAEGDYVIIRESKKLSRDIMAQRKAAAAARAKAQPAKKGVKAAEKTAAPAKK